MQALPPWPRIYPIHTPLVTLRLLIGTSRTPFNPVGYFKAALRNRYEPNKPQPKTQSEINMNIQVREKLGNDWWEELGKLWSDIAAARLRQRDKYLSRRGNIIEFLKDGTADMLHRVSRMQPQEFLSLYA